VVDLKIAGSSSAIIKLILPGKEKLSHVAFIAELTYKEINVKS
jgi:hypothetical protein